MKQTNEREGESKKQLVIEKRGGLCSSKSHLLRYFLSAQRRKK